MKILLVKPAFARILDNTVYCTYPLGLMYVAAMLRDRGHDVKIWHDDVSNDGPINSHSAWFQPIRSMEPGPEIMDPLVHEMETWQPEVVGVSYTTIDRLGAHAVAYAANKLGIRTVAGGIHPSLLPVEELSPGGPFDAVVIGEGDNEEAALAFEYDVWDWEITPVGHIPLGRASSSFRIQDHSYSLFDKLLPARDAVINHERYHPYLSGMIQTQRGCPYNCGYCAAPSVFGRKVRTRDPQKVVAEIESIGVKNGRIIDDSFFVVKQHGRDLCNELERANMGYTWVCDIAMQDATEDALEHMARAGCVAINSGIESATERWRELSGKHIVQGQPESLLQRANGRGISVHYYFMVGFPGETYTEMHATLDMAERLKDMGAVPCISIVTPYPKTRLWDLACDVADLHDPDWSVFIHQNSSVKLADCTSDEWDRVVQRGNEINP